MSMSRPRASCSPSPRWMTVYDETLPRPRPPHAILAVEALPGQFDQRADSAAQCIQLLTGGERPLVAHRHGLRLLGGELTERRTWTRSRRYLINPVESREASLDKPDTLAAGRTAVPGRRGRARRASPPWTRPGWTGLLEQYGLAMDLADLKFLQAYFRDEEKPGPHHHRAAGGGHLLVRPLPPHHLLHPSWTRWTIAGPRGSGGLSAATWPPGRRSTARRRPPSGPRP